MWDVVFFVCFFEVFFGRLFGVVFGVVFFVYGVFFVLVSLCISDYVLLVSDWNVLGRLCSDSYSIMMFSVMVIGKFIVNRFIDGVVWLIVVKLMFIISSEVIVGSVMCMVLVNSCVLNIIIVCMLLVLIMLLFGGSVWKFLVSSVISCRWLFIVRKISVISIMYSWFSIGVLLLFLGFIILEKFRFMFCDIIWLLNVIVLNISLSMKLIVVLISIWLIMVVIFCVFIGLIVVGDSGVSMKVSSMMIVIWMCVGMVVLLNIGVIIINLFMWFIVYSNEFI